MVSECYPERCGKCSNPSAKSPHVTLFSRSQLLYSATMHLHPRDSCLVLHHRRHNPIYVSFPAPLSFSSHQSISSPQSHVSVRRPRSLALRRRRLPSRFLLKIFAAAAIIDFTVYTAAVINTTTTTAINTTTTTINTTAAVSLIATHLAQNIRGKPDIYIYIYKLYIYIYGTFYEILMLVNFIYIASNSKRYIFKRVCTVDFLFSALHTTPFLYAKIYFGVLHLLRARIATSDTTPGSNPT